MYCTDFMFDNELASDYGLMICSFNGGSSIETIRNGADIEFVTVKTPGSAKWRRVGADYSEVLETTFQVMKNNCNDLDDKYFTVEEQRKINRWLNREDKFYKFRVVKEGYEKIFFEAKINVNKIELGENVVGFELTVTTNRPFALMDKVEYNYAIDEPNGEIWDSVGIHDESDKIGYIYPYIQVKCLRDGNLNITNNINNETTTISDCVEGEIITMDNENHILLSSVRGVSVIDDFNFVWVKIENTYDNRNNDYAISLPCEFHMSYHPIAKIGF